MYSNQPSIISSVLGSPHRIYLPILHREIFVFRGIGLIRRLGLRRLVQEDVRVMHHTAVPRPALYRRHPRVLFEIGRNREVEVGIRRVHFTTCSSGMGITTSGWPILQPFTKRGAAARSFASPSGAPSSTQVFIVAISVSVSRRSLEKLP